ncbi:MAG TPA: hypothetical protein PLD94_10625 [Ornithinibacter sp.]|nr:hypothetical protein [Ornithinibacter sp.]
MVRGSEDFLRLAAKLDEGDRKLNNGIRRRLREVAKPLGSEVRDTLAESMPRRGGLSAMIGRSKVSVSSTSDTGERVEIRVRSAGHDLEAMDAGMLRHPTFGHKPWVGQSVPSGSAAKALEAGAPKVRDALMREVETLLDEIGD